MIPPSLRLSGQIFGQALYFPVERLHCLRLWLISRVHAQEKCREEGAANLNEPTRINEVRDAPLFISDRLIGDRHEVPRLLINETHQKRFACGRRSERDLHRQKALLAAKLLVLLSKLSSLPKDDLYALRIPAEGLWWNRHLVRCLLICNEKERQGRGRGQKAHEETTKFC